MMDLTPFFVFLVINLLPANVNKCEFYVDNSLTKVVMKKEGDNTWSYQQGTEAPLKLIVEGNKIKYTDSEDFIEMDKGFVMSSFPRNMRKINKHPIKLQTDQGQTMPPILVTQQKRTFSLTQSGEMSLFNKMRIVY
jgi:hypothetical protein